ncbi:hypothetical protein BP5796_13125 [Coleophoma crateriformis]|uniref:UBA domain-containing protein n=1 Tax=Coleophoma crateriformis TaxID=565419 RepID=A0A3D8Q506_9HELO|nr:hypothetical protein BP5796_13125 [Coleophoma crateriformis]
MFPLEGCIEQDNTEEKHLWNLSPWQVLIQLYPLYIARSRLPTLGDMPIDENIDATMEVDILEDWTQAALSKSTGNFSVAEQRRLELSQETLEEHRKSKSNKKIRDTDNTIRTMSSGLTATIRPMTAYEEGLSEFTQKQKNLICTRCAALKNITEIGFSANQVVQALDHAGVGTDIQGLITWIMDHYPNGPPREPERFDQETPSTATSKSPVKNENLPLEASPKIANQWLQIEGQRTQPFQVQQQQQQPLHKPQIQKQSRRPKGQQIWEKVPIKSKSPSIDTITNSAKSKKHRRKRRNAVADGGDDTSKTPISEAKSSEGIIELDSGNSQWFLASRDGNTDQLSLSSYQITLLKTFLNTLLLEGQE